MTQTVTQDLRVCGHRSGFLANGMCRSCNQIQYRATTARASQKDFESFGPRVWTTLARRPRPLDVHESRALNDVARIHRGETEQDGRALSTRPRGRGRTRYCLDCGQPGAGLRTANRCEHCYRMRIEAASR